MTYQEQISSPKWQRKRLEILNLSGFKCEKCNCEEKQLHVHHRFYLKGRKAWEYDNDVFQVLCHSCHENEHKKEDNNKKFDLESHIYSKLKKYNSEDKSIFSSLISSIINEIINMQNARHGSNDLSFDITYISMYLYIINNGCSRDSITIDNVIEIMFNAIHKSKNTKYA